MKQILSGKVVIVADVHQNISYVNKILDLESNFDYIIFLGDFFDTFLQPDNKKIYTVIETCEWINDKFLEWGEKVIWLLGNHDCAYLASYNKKSDSVSYYPQYFCSGWGRGKAIEFNTFISPDWLNRLELCIQLGENTIVSHAGFHPLHFKPYKSEFENISWYYNEWEKDKKTFHNTLRHWIWYVGASRMGSNVVGSPIWLDFSSEFEPLNEIKQIVGHTAKDKPRCRKSFDKKLENWCVDCNQTVYGVWENEQFLIKDLKGEILNEQ